MNVVLDFIGLIGGVGAMVVGISAFASKLWADWFMKKKTLEYDKQIALYKDTLETEREKYKALYDQIIYKNKSIFDTEFKIYQELTPIIIDIRWSKKQLEMVMMYVWLYSITNEKDYWNEYMLQIDE